MPDAASAGPYGALWDWRRRVAEAYAAVRADPAPQDAWLAWRASRDMLFRQHAQSPLEPADKAGFHGLAFLPYDPAMRFTVSLTPVAGAKLPVSAGLDGALSLQPFALTTGLSGALGRELTLYWVEGYGGGVFLPFDDASSGHDTYGAGRYLLDTIKGADLGVTADGLTVLDFNFAYNPSCCYSDRYVCPLSPVDNRIPASINVGERSFERLAAE